MRQIDQRAGVPDDLQPAMQAARSLPTEQLPKLLGQLEEIRSTAWARLSAPAAVESHDELLNIEQAAARLQMSVSYLYHNADRLPFARRVGRTLRFSAQGISSYISRGKR
jgi:hypothetical protein